MKNTKNHYRTWPNQWRQFREAELARLLQRQKLSPFPKVFEKFNSNGKGKFTFHVLLMKPPILGKTEKLILEQNC